MKKLTLQTYNNLYFILSDGVIVGDYKNLSDAESIIRANAEPSNTTKRKVTKTAKSNDFDAFGYPVSRMQKKLA